MRKKIFVAQDRCPRAGCKRLIFSPDFYQKIQHPNAHVITTAIQQMQKIATFTICLAKATRQNHELQEMVRLRLQ